VSDEGIYLCPVCGKPFDSTDRLFDWAISAHEKDHAPQRNNPANMIRHNENALMWVCKLCGDPLHPGEYTARQKVITHCREKHGSTTASSVPVTARGGRRGRSGPGGKAVDLAEDVGEAIVDGISAVFRGIGNALSGD
jgi:ribosomal protein L37AE/L43A